jgi:CRP-like cAMP-binding protein
MRAVSEDVLAQMRRLLDPELRISVGAWDALTQIWEPFEAKRKELLCTVGAVEKYLYFVESGVQRAFYQHGNDKDYTLVFTYTGSFSGVADSFLTGHPSRYYFETLSRSRFMRCSRERLMMVCGTFPEIESAMLRLTAAVMEGLLQRQIELQCFSAEEKFRALLQRSPHVLGLIPQRYLASYLGIDASTFSKLLSTVRL